MNTTLATTTKQELNQTRDMITGSENLLSHEELTLHIRGCVLNDRHSQKAIYTSFYGLSMAICKRYSNSQDDTIEIMNDGFLKIFKEIHRYQPAYADVVGSFRGWLRKIMMRAAIDHYRKNKKYRFTAEVDNGIIQLSDKREDALDRISYREIIRSIQELTPVYRNVLRLFILEGCKHEEISNRLGITVGASKSNLAKARVQLQKILFHRNDIEYCQTKNDRDLSISHSGN
jgi:RNA polymerase sigma factor (sigma-70 family)